MAKKTKRNSTPESACYPSVAALAGAAFADDPAFVEGFERRLAARELVKALAVVRARAGLSQQELAAKMGCGQPKVSKIENGLDADVRFGDVVKYLEASGHEARIQLVPAGLTLAEEVKQHAFRIKHLLDEMVDLVGSDGTIRTGVAQFIREVDYNLSQFTLNAATALPKLPPGPARPVQVDAPEPDGGPVNRPKALPARKPAETRC